MIPVVGSDAIVNAEFGYVIFPIFLGSVIHVAIAVFIGNLSTNPKRRYPIYWKFWENFAVPTSW